MGTHRTPKLENPGAGGRGAMRRAHQSPLMAEMTKTEMADRIHKLENALSEIEGMTPKGNPEYSNQVWNIARKALEK